MQPLWTDIFKSAVSSLNLSSDESPSTFLILSDNLDALFPDLLLESLATSRGRSRGFLVVSSTSSLTRLSVFANSSRNKV